MKDIIEYLYTGNIQSIFNKNNPKIEENLHKFVELSQLFQLDELHNLCKNLLEDSGDLLLINITYKKIPRKF